MPLAFSEVDGCFIGAVFLLIALASVADIWPKDTPRQRVIRRGGQRSIRR